MHQLFNYFFSTNFQSRFQNLLSSLTESNQTAPPPQEIKQLIEILSGQNQHTRAQIAFATIIKKFTNPLTKDDWIYELKMLIIVDRLVEEHMFCNEIGKISANIFDKMVEENFQGLKTHKIIGSFWKLICYIAKISDSELHILCFKRSQRVIFLKKLSFKQLLQQLQIVNTFFRISFEVAKQIIGRNEQKRDYITTIQESGLIKNIILNLSYKFILFYSCGLQCCHSILPLLSCGEQQQLRTLRKLCTKFQSHSLQFIQFLQFFKFVKGIEQFNFQQLNPFQNVNMIALIDQLLRQSDTRQSKVPMREFTKSYGGGIKVELRGIGEANERNILFPRILFKIEQKPIVYNSFAEWHSSYSDQFPQNQIMTLDLIMDIRNEKEQLIQYDLSNTSQNSYDDLGNCRQVNILQFTSPNDSKIISTVNLPQNYFKKDTKILSFENIYSNYNAIWNEL